MKKKLFNIFCFSLIVLFGASCYFCVAPQSLSSAYALESVLESEVNLNLSTDSDFLNSIDHFTFQDKTDGYDTSLTLDPAYCLRDDYVIYTQNQDRNGLCWTFAGNTVVETTLMKATGEFYDFSEGWLSVAMKQVQQELAGIKDFEYLVGDGGHMAYYNTVAKNLGLVLEQDFDYDDFYWAEETNSAYYYNFYKNKANTQIMENLTPVMFDKDSANSRKSIKQHIMLHGAVQTYFYCNQDQFVESEDYTYVSPIAYEQEAHAVTIIGWDDNFTQTINNQTHKGAWIILNSWGNDWGNDGVFYLFYDDPNFVNGYHGYIYSEQDDGLSIHTNIESGYTYQTNLAGKYYRPYTAQTGVSTQQKNIVFVNDTQKDYQIKYNYTLSSGAKIDSIRVEYDGKDVTDTLVALETGKNYFIVKNLSQDVPLGAYKIVTTYSNDLASESYINNFYICDGMEIGSMLSTISNDSFNTNGHYWYYNSYNHQGDLSLTFVTNQRTTEQAFVVLYSSTYGIMSPENTTISVKVGSGQASLYNYDVNTEFSADYKVTENSLVITYTLSHISGLTKNIYLNILYSQTPLTQIHYHTDGGDNSQNPERQVKNASGQIELVAPTRVGYEFMGWYYDAGFNNALRKNGESYFLEGSGISNISAPNNYLHNQPANSEVATKYYNSSSTAFVYARWQLKDIVDASLVNNLEKVYHIDEFTLTLSYSHELSAYSTIAWYIDDVVVPNETGLTLTQQLDAGEYSIKAVITISHQGNVVIAEKVLPVTVHHLVLIDTVGELEFDNENFSWVPPESMPEASTYVVSLYKIARPNDILVKSVEVATAQFNILQNIETYGEYYIKVAIKNGENLSQEIKSAKTIIYQVDFLEENDSASAYAEQFVVENECVILPETSPEKLGYTFDKYMLAGKEYDFSTKVVGNLTIYASWTVDAIDTFNESAPITKTFNDIESIISVSPTHDASTSDDQFTYAWYKMEKILPYEIPNATTNELAVKNVADNGQYFCRVTFTDSKGRSVTTDSPIIQVEIAKADATLVVEYCDSNFTYNGLEQTISYRANLYSQGKAIAGVEFYEEIFDPADNSSRRNGATFVDVPLNTLDKNNENYDLGGVYKLIILTENSANYTAGTATVDVFVARAESSLVVKKSYQIFDYNGKSHQADLEYTFVDGNKEQEAVFDTYCLNVGAYEGTLIAQQSRNYNSSSVPVKVIINPAKLTIRVKNITSLLFFQEKELSYEIVEGKLYNYDTLGVILSADVNTNRIGSYDIVFESSNPNYFVTLYEGVYRVTAWPYILGICLIIGLFTLCVYLSSKRKFVYDFETNGGTDLKPIETQRRKNAVFVAPTKKGYEFAGWYKDEELTIPYTKRPKKSKGITLYAKWEKTQNAPVSKDAIMVESLVREINEKINPKPPVIKTSQEQPEDNLEIKIDSPKVLSKEEKMEQIIQNAKTNNGENLSQKQIDKIIKDLTSN